MSKNSDKSLIFVLGGLSSGGAERVASHLMNYWVDQGWNIHLIIGHTPEYDFYSIPSGINRIVIHTGSPSGNKIVALFKNLPYVWHLRKAIKKIESPYVISFLTRTNIHTVLACLGLKKRVIISERNDTTREEHPWPWPQLRKALYKYADVVTANSKIALSGMRDYVSKEKLTLTPNPVVLPERRSKPAKSTRMINVGRLTHQKAQNILIEAISLIDEKKRKAWTLDILGIGEEEMNLKKLCNEKDLADTVNFCGLVKEIKTVYETGAIFILSSRYEGTPNALLEAMSFGLPCIISDTILGANDIFEDGETGLLFSSGDPGDLAKKIEKLIEDPEYRQKMGEKARKRVETYSPANVMPIWDRVLTNEIRVS